MNPAITVYCAKLLIPVTAPVIPEGAVAVYQGRVIHSGTYAWVMDCVRQEFGAGVSLKVRRWDGILAPGLVNAHTHLQYTCMESVGQGVYADFRAWERGFNAVYDPLQGQGGVWAASARDGARRLVEAGTTAAADVVTDPEAIDALRSQDLRGVAYWEIMDWTNQAWQEQGRASLLAQLAGFSAQGIRSLGISPHAPYSLESDPFLDMPDIARRLGLRQHIHLGETPLEKGERPAALTTYTAAGWRQNHWQSYKELKKQGLGASAIQFVDQLGALGPDVHIAHGVYADKEDRRLLRQRGVSVALCPRSNRITATLRDAPVADYLQEGNLLCVGTDSLSSSPSLDVLDETPVLFDMARQQGYQGADLSHRLIRAVTLGGAEALGLSSGPDRIGQINAGARADLAFFAVDVSNSSPQGIEDSLEAFVRAGGGTARASVIGGRLTYNAGAFEESEEVDNAGE